MSYSVNLYFKISLISFLMCCNSINSDRDLLQSSEVYSRGHRYTNWFYAYKLDSLIQCIVNNNFHSYEIDTLISCNVDYNYTIQNLKDFREKVDIKLGKEVNFLNEQFYVFCKENKHVYGYFRYSQFSKVDRPIQTSFRFDRNNNIYLFVVKPLPHEAPTIYSDYKTKTRLRLPFEGEWYVAWGGRSINYNNHTIAPDQRFAYDFKIRKDGYSFINNGLKNEDYYCYNKKILAPGDGKIVDIENNIKENRIGEKPKISGNRVIIDHGNGEFSVLSHFKKGSIVVDVGDYVISGQFLGFCGNSGQSLEPHLHYHLQNSPVMFEGDGLPAQFQFYKANGQVIQRGEPFWNEKIRNVNH